MACSHSPVWPLDLSDSLQFFAAAHTSPHFFVVPICQEPVTAGAHPYNPLKRRQLPGPFVPTFQRLIFFIHFRVK
jgi:hypothetical protein